MKRFRQFFFVFFVFLLVLKSLNIQVFAEPVIYAPAFVLMESDSGRILYAQNEHQRMFPAATTMILTAILAYEHLDMDRIYIAGNEVSSLPFDSARNHHEIGEAILGINLLRGMLIGAGNDTANIVALNVSRVVSGEFDMSFVQAQQYFAELMNERATELGAQNSRFINPHGYHHQNHTTTAYDMAQIARHAMSIPTIAEIAALPAFSGAMAGTNLRENLPEAINAQNPSLVNRSWRSPNDLLHAGANFFAGANGLRTGRTNLAGDVLVASAMRANINLIVVTMNSPFINDEPTRWRDAHNLFNHGFDNFAHRTLIADIAHIGIQNPRLGEDEYLEVFLYEPEFTQFLSHIEADSITAQVSWLDDVTVQYEDEWLVVPSIEEGQELGRVDYILDGEVLNSTTIHAARDVQERSTASDINYYTDWVISTFFSRSAVPYWIAAISVGALLTIAYFLLRNKIREKKKHQKYKFRK
ncbi:MAG: hypothetical protein FWE33_02200 [Defluviitaleaceae bacterium]|nr:hypothetical protein [Defluviitaleaceae bacterium]